MSEGIELSLDPNDLTLGDMEDFEALVGKSIEDIVKPVPVLDDEGKRIFDKKGRPEMTVKIPAKALVALVFLAERGKRPGFTIEDARKVKIGSLNLSSTSEADEKKADAA